MLTDAGAIVLALVAMRLAAPAGDGCLHLRAEAGRDPLRPGQRPHLGRARRRVRDRGGTPAPRPARCGGRGGGGCRRSRDRGQPRRCGPAREGRPAQPERRGGVLAHRHRPVRLRRDPGRGPGDLVDRLGPRRRPRGPRGRGADGRGGVPPPARQLPGVPRGRPARRRCRASSRRRSAGSRASPTSTSSMSGRSRPASPPCRRTCWSTPPRDCHERRLVIEALLDGHASRSSTRPSRSTTATASCPRAPWVVGSIRGPADTTEAPQTPGAPPENLALYHALPNLTCS